MQGMRKRYGGGIIGVTQGDTAWTGVREVVELGRSGQGRRATDVPDGLPKQGRSAELPIGGLTRPGRDKDGDADAIFQPECPEYRDHLGGGKHPPPKVPTMRHAGPMEDIKRQAPHHRTLQKGRGKKEASDGGGGVEG